ncbi:MAG TPA: FAD-binding oxidoreductase [Phenylobacterium sp.]|jgi:glycine/D-amino acid oxidase-like deaminating enzyme|uniref:FAD-binding oxidoreductase n=1 Tax=Phenylobacterium sp. TaxID=1871053 RepID=UPI002D339C04|nr:FAD-binding oxidoreductase [Phenylobacterium sp.]HZZ67710.1 FAD-binding oxidoreductase [Phenylobacterium sp.]
MARFGNLDRRALIRASAGAGLLGAPLLGLGGCATVAAPAPGAASASAANGLILRPPIAPVRASMDRVFDITVCLRPFRAQGPRIEAQEIGDTLVVHNYGHGGSGWSLSWGSGTVALRKAMARAPKEIAVVGCGALGLTSAILAQEAGAKVTIYAKDLLPDARSARATGSWTPDSRIALTGAAAPGFGDLWEEMARISFKRYRRYLGLPGTPVEWRDRYVLLDDEPPAGPPSPNPQALQFAEYSDRIADITPRDEHLPQGATPFPVPRVRKSSQLQYNVADYAHILMADFLAGGGRIERREFHDLSELATLKEKVVINCPGYGARALCRDESIVPVRGQIAWLIPQPEVNYSVYYRRVGMVSRRDGIVVQALWGGDMMGYGDDHEVIDRTEAERAVNVLADLYARMKA